ncbi:MAG TPA: hypothetical protein VM533_09840, partial [Fimbriiglobus sp.]|nr:hypothetical protein [Fimbriiglobus sp.]
MKILIGAVISLHPFSPGNAWNRLHYALGFRDLGHDVYYLEEVEPRACIDRHGRPCRFEESVNREYFRTVMDSFGFTDRACQIYDRGEATAGLSLSAVAALAREADLLLNISGHVRTLAVLENARLRVYLDQDPVYTQLWHAEYGKEFNFTGHDVYFTVGLNIGTPHTDIPDCGVRWNHTLPPVVLGHWPVRHDPAAARFTTVASLGRYSDLSYRGEWYRSKFEELMRYADLPQRTGQGMEAALKGYSEDDPDLRPLRDGGWSVFDAARLADLSAHREYIAGSRAEVGIAKHAYVHGRSGWFSDRSAVYLASGKPVLTQATGFERYLPAGRGLVAFADAGEAAAGVESINRDYPAHCRAARALAEEYLDHRKVLPALLEACSWVPA